MCCFGYEVIVVQFNCRCRLKSIMCLLTPFEAFLELSLPTEALVLRFIIYFLTLHFLQRSIYFDYVLPLDFTLRIQVQLYVWPSNLVLLFLKLSHTICYIFPPESEQAILDLFRVPLLVLT